MDKSSRTSKSIKNSVVAIIFYLVRLILQFFSRKIFLEYLGTEVLGLNTTAMNLLEFLNLAELGIAPAISFTLYKPLRENNKEELNEIISLQGHFFKRIGIFIIGGAIILMFFFPLIFKKMALPLWYAYGAFSVLLLSSVLGYFINYKQILLTASQQNYKITYSFGSCSLIKIVVQIVVVSYLTNPFIWWLIIEGLFAIIGSIVLEYMTKQTFPFLCQSSITFGELRLKYYIIIVKIKQLVFHKLGGYVLNQTSPLIIYAFLSLTSVAVYGNYLIIINGVTALFNAAFSGVSASVGDLVSEGNKERILEIFNELFSIRFYLIAILCFGIITYSPYFILLWIGPEYILPMSTVLLIVANMYIILSRSTVEAYLFANGQFQDIWSPIIEAILNLGCSIWFGFLWGLNGILFGVLLSLFIVVFLWKPIFLFHWGFKISCWNYFKLYLTHIGATIMTVILWAILNSLLGDYSISNWTQLLLYGLSGTIVFGGLLFTFMLIFKCQFYKTFKRIIHIK